MAQSSPLLRILDVEPEDIDLVGSEGAKLAELVQAGLPVPDGFIIPTSIYFRFFKAHALGTKITHLLRTVNYDDPHSLLQVSSHIRNVIISAEVPESIQVEIVRAYRQLGGVLKDAPVTLSLSAPSKQSRASWQNPAQPVSGEAALLLSIKTLWAAQFEAKILLYHHRERLDHFHSGVAVIVQRTVAADISGVAFSSHLTTRGNTECLIEAVFGTPEILTRGIATPDRYTVTKTEPTLTKKTLAEQAVQFTYLNGRLHEVPVAKQYQTAYKLSDKEILELANLAAMIEHRCYFPQRIIWAKDGKQFFILKVTEYHGGVALEEPTPKHQVLLTGTSGSGPTVSGRVQIVSRPKDIGSVKTGDIIVTDTLSASLTPAIKKAAGVITEEKTDPAKHSDLLRKFSLPLIAGVAQARKLLQPDSIITVNGTRKEIYHGGVLSPVTMEKKRLRPKRATRLYLSLQHETTQPLDMPPIDGVFLPADQIISSLLVHPKQLLRNGKGTTYSRKLAERIASISLAYQPRPVIYCASNLTSAAYRQLDGGRAFEPEEPDPILGYHGAIRAVHDPEVFALELDAISYVRNTLNGKNLWLMIPPARTPSELFQVKKQIIAAGLLRSATFQVWFRVSIPGNVIRLEEFLKVGLDGIMIDSEMLTTLFLGTDRANPDVAHLANTEDEALLQAYRHIITVGNKQEVPVVFSGRHPSSPLLKSLTSWGISGLAVEPYALENVEKTIYNYERQLIS